MAVAWSGHLLCRCVADSMSLNAVPHRAGFLFTWLCRYERSPLTPTTFPDYDSLVAAARAALAAHYATLEPNVPDQMQPIPDPLLEPCCGGGIWAIDNCTCDHYQPHEVYP